MVKELDEYEIALENGLYLKRDAYLNLLYWKNNRVRKHIACFLKGARRVGNLFLL